MGVFPDTWLLWLILACVCMVLEFCTVSLVSVWFSAGAVVAMFVSFSNAPVAVEVAIFLAVSSFLFALLRPFAARHFNVSREKTNLGTLDGAEAIVVEPIDNIKGTGRVFVNENEWKARSTGNDICLPEGAVVAIEKIEGVTLIVDSIKK